MKAEIAKACKWYRALSYNTVNMRKNTPLKIQDREEEDNLVEPCQPRTLNQAPNTAERAIATAIQVLLTRIIQWSSKLG